LCIGSISCVGRRSSPEHERALRTGKPVLERKKSIRKTPWGGEKVTRTGFLRHPDSEYNGCDAYAKKGVGH